MGFTFQKLVVGEIISSVGGLTFRELTPTQTPTFIPKYENGQLDLSTLGLKPGIHRITVTALAKGLEESDHSDVVLYIIN